ncbi:MAG: hypothetical protein ACRDRS_12445 [Pseudonocardiaceae bacterium]
MISSQAPVFTESLAAEFMVSAEATESILIPLSSRTFARRCGSLVRCSMRFLRYRVNSRISRSFAGE